jgi:hypothetical protein
MESLIGLVFLVIFVMVIIHIRRRIFNSDNTLLKTAVSAGDAIVWVRFIFGIIFFIFFIFMFSALGTDTVIKIGG